ncbi:MAG: hypothetical protein CMO61_00090 [Verrucomicrobiales bacterium]|nr:hypothetical protein [Verrucomicrobiales bacterium]|tara:strand:- start:807 stop:1001 length:195 start_codon:yes stop_codon:yes gene_type:complete
MSVAVFQKALLRLALPAAVLLAFAVAGDSDFEDAIASEAAYCDRLAGGEHADYLNIQEVCDARY